MNQNSAIPERERRERLDSERANAFRALCSEYTTTANPGRAEEIRQALSLHLLREGLATPGDEYPLIKLMDNLEYERLRSGKGMLPDLCYKREPGKKSKFEREHEEYIKLCRDYVAIDDPAEIMEIRGKLMSWLYSKGRITLDNNRVLVNLLDDLDMQRLRQVKSIDYFGARKEPGYRKK